MAMAMQFGVQWTRLLILICCCCCILALGDPLDQRIESICTVGSKGFDCTEKSNKLLIKGGTVVNADHQQQADVYVEDGIITLVAPNLKATDDVRVIDATGKFVMPDSRINFQESRSLSTSMNAEHSQVANSHKLTPHFCLSSNTEPSSIYQDAIEECLHNVIIPDY